MNSNERRFVMKIDGVGRKKENQLNSNRIIGVKYLSNIEFSLSFDDELLEDEKR